MAKRARPRTNTERGRASRLRSKARRQVLTPAEARWLAAYDRAVRAAKRSRTERRAKRATRKGAKAPRLPGALALARGIAQGLSEWTGDPSPDIEADWQRRPRQGKPGSATATAEIDPFLIPAAESGLDADFESDMPRLPLLRAALAAVRVLVRVEEEDGSSFERWLGIAALQSDRDNLAADIAKNTDELVERYRGTEILGWGSYVTRVKQ